MSIAPSWYQDRKHPSHTDVDFWRLLLIKGHPEAQHGVLRPAVYDFVQFVSIKKKTSGEIPLMMLLSSSAARKMSLFADVSHPWGSALEPASIVVPIAPTAK